MPETPAIKYWDSNVFLSYLNELPDRTPVLDALLDEASKSTDTAKIYTSTLTQVEVAFAASEQAQQVLDANVEQRINDLWADTSAVVSVEYHSGIGQIAKSLIREALTRGWSLKPLDAVHLATAQWLSSSGLVVQAFHTYDRGLFKYESLVDFTIHEPSTSQPRMI